MTEKGHCQMCYEERPSDELQSKGGIIKVCQDCLDDDGTVVDREVNESMADKEFTTEHIDIGEIEIETDEYPYINEFAVVGDFGFQRKGGLLNVEKTGTVWTVFIPISDVDFPSVWKDHEGHHGVLVADGEVIGGGKVTDVYEPEGEGELHVLVDQYAMGDAP